MFLFLMFSKSVLFHKRSYPFLAFTRTQMQQIGKEGHIIGNGSKVVIALSSFK